MNPTSLDAALPDFIKSCTSLHEALMPIGVIMLAVGFIAEFWHAPTSPVELVKFLAKVFFVVLLMTRSFDLINSAQVNVKQFVEEHVPSLPEKVAERFKTKMAEAQQTPEGEEQSFWDSLFSVDNLFQQIIAAVLWLVAWMAMALLFEIYTLQRALLIFNWCIGTILLPTLVIRPLSHIGMRHCLRVTAILLWPIGIALASALTDGLLGVATDGNFLGDSGVAGALGRGIIALLCLGVISVHIIVSTIAAPVIIQRIITGGAGAAVALTQSASLVANVGLPSGFGIPSAAAYARRLGRAAYVWGNRAWHRHGSAGSGATGNPGNPPTTPVPTTHPPLPAKGADAPWQPNPDDPTGDKAARDLFRKAQPSFQRKP